jgi:formate-dependent phosphoribosylglycinamide formyltransferase (GAR transformylase)
MENADLNIRQTSTEEAEATVQSSGSGRSSKYENVAEAWEQAQEQGEAVVLEDVTENDVQNIRNLIYRRFDKEGVIVRSTKKGEDNFNVAIRERQDGEYLRDDEDEDTKAEATSEDTAESTEDTEDTSEEEGEFSPSFE